MRSNSIELYNILHDLYFSLNGDFLDALQLYTADLSDELKEAGTIYHSYDIESLIKKYSDKYPNGLNIDDLIELKNNNSIGCMMDYYELIEYMLTDIDI